MSRFRHRLTAVALGGLLSGAALLFGAPAQAEGPDDADPQVTFDGSGSLFGLTCESAPDIESMTVPANGLVEIVNHTGRSARLRLGGVDQGVLPAGGSTKVIFRHGSTSVAVEPDCAIGQSPAPMQVTTVPASEAPAFSPVPDPVRPPILPAPPATTSATSPPTSPATSAPVSAAGENPLRADALPAPASPKTWHPPRTGRETLPSRVRETTAPVVPRRAHTSPALTTAPAVVPSPSSASAAVPAAERPSSAAGSQAAAEPVAALRPAESRPPIGLLALVAAVCALGVGISAIRAFVSQRAYRSNVA